MAFMFLGVIPISEGYDFLGEPKHKNWTPPKFVREGQIKNESVEESQTDKRIEEKIEENPKEELPAIPYIPLEDLKDKPPVEETPVVVEDTVDTPALVKEPQDVVKEDLPPLPDIPVQEENLNYAEMEYSTLLNGNAMSNLPESESGNYVIIYRSQSCPYCDKLIAELKGNIGDYTLVIVKCSGTVRDVFYNRWLYYYPSFIVIKDRKVRYYGYGYRSLGEFKRFL